MNLFLENKIKTLAQNKQNMLIHLRKIYNVENYFDPVWGNVLFCSVIDGWGFWLEDFAYFYAKRWKMNFQILKKFFWGYFYYD